MSTVARDLDHHEPAPERWTMLPGKRPLIVGAYGMQNLGDEAILAGLLTRLGSGAEPLVLSAAPAETTALHGVAAVGPRGAPAALLHCDTVVIGGGGLFSSHVGTLARLIPAFGLLAMALRKPIDITGVSVDRSTPRVLQPLVRALFSRARSVSVRDESSARLLQSWGVTAAIQPDLSHYFRPALPGRGHDLLRQAGLDPCVPTVALCLTAVEPRFDAPLAAAIPGLVSAMPGLQFCIVPMSRHRDQLRHNDMIQARHLQQLEPRIGIVDATSPADVPAAIGECAAAVCMRYHSLLFAARAGVPIVGIPYAQKCRNWLDEHGLAPVDCTTADLERALESALQADSRLQMQAVAG